METLGKVKIGSKKVNTHPKIPEIDLEDFFRVGPKGPRALGDPKKGPSSLGKIIAKLSPGRSAGRDPWAWGSKCGPRGAGITGREGPWEPKNGRETRGNICLEIGKKMPEKWKHFVGPWKRL